MKLVHAERLGEAFDSQLVIGVRESYGEVHSRFSLDCVNIFLMKTEKSLTISFSVNLCSNPDDKLQIYRDNFEKAYLDSTERFYRTQAPSYLQQNGVQNYMKYVRPARHQILDYMIFSQSDCIAERLVFAVIYYHVSVYRQTLN